jgi:hypothetical protein
MIPVTLVNAMMSTVIVYFVPNSMQLYLNFYGYNFCCRFFMSRVKRVDTFFR